MCKEFDIIGFIDATLKAQAVFKSLASIRSQFSLTTC